MNVSKKVMSIALTASMLLSMSMPCFAASTKNNITSIGTGAPQEQEKNIHSYSSAIHYPNKEIKKKKFATMPDFPKDWNDKKAVAKYEKAFDKYTEEKDKNRETFIKPYKEALSKVLPPDELNAIGFYEDIHLKVGEKKVVHVWQYGMFSDDKTTWKTENINRPYLVYTEKSVNFTAAATVEKLYKSKTNDHCLLLTLEGVKPGTEILYVEAYPIGAGLIRIIVDDDKAPSKEDKKASTKKDKKTSTKKDSASTKKTNSDSKKVVLSLKNK